MMKYDFLALWIFSVKVPAYFHPFLQASVPMKISGTSALKPSTRRWNSARVYSRTMARKTASEPDCTGTWRYSKTLGRFKTCFANKNHSHRIHGAAIYGNIYHHYTPNVSIYTIHGSYGMEHLRKNEENSQNAKNGNMWDNQGETMM